MKSTLAYFGVTSEGRLGGGGEADVYALPDRKVLRLMKPRAEAASETRRRELLSEFQAGATHLPFNIPEVIDHGAYDGHFYTIERRIAGIAMDKALGGSPPYRDLLVRNYLKAALDIGAIMSPGFFGELAGPKPVQALDQTSAFGAIAARSLAQAGINSVDGAALAAALPQTESAGIAHIDYFPGNVMCDGPNVTGVIDFGYATLAADPRLTPIIAVACLHSRIAANANDADREVADDWLTQRGWMSFMSPTNRWLAAFWAFAFTDDPPLEIWGRAQLGL